MFTIVKRTDRTNSYCWRFIVHHMTTLKVINNNSSFTMYVHVANKSTLLKVKALKYKNYKKHNNIRKFTTLIVFK